MAHGDDRYTLGFQHFQRLGHVEDRLGARRDDGDGGLGQFHEVGGDVKAVFRALMHAADATGGEDFDARKIGGDHGGGDGGGTCPARGDADGHIGARQFGHVLGLGQIAQLVIVQTDVQRAADHGDGGGNGPCVADVLFDLPRHFEVLRIGHAMGDDGAFQGHDWRGVFAGLGHLGAEGQGQGGCGGGHILVSPET